MPITLKKVVMISLCLFVPASFAQSVLERAAKDEIVVMADEEPAMKRAFTLAKNSLDAFLTKAAAPPAQTGGYALKVGVREGKNTEYFWISQFTSNGDKFSGKINNEPRLVKSVQFGQTYVFNRNQIVDWLYIDGVAKRMYGNYTACALLEKESKANAEAVKKQYGMVCE